LRPFDTAGIFHPADAGGGLRRRAVRGAGVTVFTSGLGLVLQIVSTVVLSRLLTPKDFGVVTMVTTFSLLLVNFGLNGFTEALVQWEEVDRVLASNLFWISIGAGLLLTGSFAAAGALMARFYRDPLVTHVAIGVSGTIFLTSLSVQHLALLKRAMCFTQISAIDILSRIFSLAVSIVLAWRGWAYWALVAGVLAQPLVQSIGAWALCLWIPSLPRRAKGTGAMVRFAIHVYGRFSVNYFARNMDNLLVGWRFDAQSLGFYKKAYDLFALSAGQLVAPLAVVAVSALSRLNRDHAKYRQYLIGSLAILSFVGMGVGADLTLIGNDVIRLLLGPGWTAAGRIFMFFGPGIGIMVLYGTHGWIHLSIGRADRWFRWGILEFIFTGLLFLLGLRWGPVGIAVAWTASFWILTIPAFWYAGRPIHLGIEPVIAAVCRLEVRSGLPAGGLRVRRDRSKFSNFYCSSRRIRRLHPNHDDIRVVWRTLSRHGDPFAPGMRSSLPGRPAFAGDDSMGGNLKVARGWRRGSWHCPGGKDYASRIRGNNLTRNFNLTFCV
jgi:O-antigen/teichoic acid export membrane protein